MIQKTDDQYKNFKSDTKGRFERQESKFRRWITADGSSEFPAEKGRYHLYVSLACPWAHRTLIVRKLRGLEEVISLSVVDPIRDEKGWRFTPEKEGCSPDPILNADYLGELYTKADPDYDRRYTVPLLWDKEKNTAVNNESREIIRMLNTAFDEFATENRELLPEEKKREIDTVIDEIYQPINNGVYRAGFAKSQEAYDEAVTDLFHALEKWEKVLSGQRYLCGDELTEADVCMFTTFFRFDPVYYVHFKCNIKRLVDYPNLWAYTRDIYQTPGVAETCHLDHIKNHYYTTHTSINPYGIVPQGPKIDYSQPHRREKISR